MRMTVVVVIRVVVAVVMAVAAPGFVTVWTQGASAGASRLQMWMLDC